MKQSHQVWFEENCKNLDKEYLKHSEPWKQSGFSGPIERWIACRKPIADCIDKPGKFLDIGCANGYLIEYVLKWVSERGLEITPYGFDISEILIELAKQRVSEFNSNFYTANAFYWKPPIKFDFVRTELVYVPKDLRADFLKRLLINYLSDNGKLLVCEYRSSNSDLTPKINEELEGMGFKVNDIRSGFWENKELTRIAIILK